MITNAIGGARRSSTVAANTNRTIPMLATRMSRIVPPNSSMTMISPIVSSASSGIRIISARPGRVSLSQVRESAVIERLPPARPVRALSAARAHSRTLECARERARQRLRLGASGVSELTLSLVDAAHDGIQAGHDRHRVSKQVAGQERADGLEVDEARVVDLEPERLVGAVADGVRAEQPARRLDGRPGAARPWPEQPGQLGHDRSVGHLLEALVDDPHALLD